MVDFYAFLAQSKWHEALLLKRLTAQQENSPMANHARALAYLVGRDYQQSYEHLLQYEPGWLDPDQWWQLIRDEKGGCYYAGILIGGGEQTMGEILIAKSLDFLENELPKLMGDTGRFADSGLCYLLSGYHENALAFFERRIGHGHIDDWFWLKQLPWWDPLRDDPRFIAMDARVEQMKAEQLALLRAANRK